MREIKFRVFMGGKMVYPPFDFWIHDGEFGTELSGLSITHKDGRVDEVTGQVMQYSGLKDEFDSEIYEGDVIFLKDYSYGSRQGTIADVVFDRGMFGIRADDKGRIMLLGGNGYEPGGVAVLGNIHEGILKKGRQ